MDSSSDYITMKLLNVSDVDSPILTSQLTPTIKRKLKHVDSDDDEGDLLNTNKLFSNDLRNRDQFFQSQTLLLSQLTQSSQQSGQFTYHKPCFVIGPKSIPFQLQSSNNDKKSADAINMTKSFFLSMQNIKNNYELIIEMVETSFLHFIYPEQYVLKFLHQFLRFYQNLSLEKCSDGTLGHLQDYCNILEHLFINEFTKPGSFWSRDDLISLFHVPPNNNSTITPTTSYEYTYLFDLIEYQIERFEQKFSISSKTSGRNSSASTNAERVLFVSTHLFSTLVDFLQKDFENFLFMNSSNYYHDISNVESGLKPIWVRMLWPKSNQKPEYMSSMVKYFIALVAKALKILSVVQNNSDHVSTQGKEYFYQNDLFYRSLFCLMSLTAESLRIGSGNVRPYLQITSTRNQVSFEFWCQMSRLKLTDDFHILQFVVNSIDHHHLQWFNLQFCLQVLNNRFVDLKHILPTIIGGNVWKTKISFRMLVAAFLTGDLDEFKIAHLRLIRQNRLRQRGSNLKNQERTPNKLSDDDRLKNAKNLLQKQNSKVSITTIDQNNEDSFHIQQHKKDKIYQRFLSCKTNYGGNALHIACRQNDSDVINHLFDQTKPNLQDNFGYTPLIDAVRFEHVVCLKKLIEASQRHEKRLDYEATVWEEKGYTALHYAVLNGNRESIRLLLENGGQHLLMIESSDGQTPEDLIELDSNMKKFISEIQCKKIENHLPRFEILAKERNMTVDRMVDYYCQMVSSLLLNYLGTIQIHRYNIDIYIEDDICDQQHHNKEQLRNDLQYQLSQQFQQIFQRTPSELELDYLMDDLEVMRKFEDYVQRFCDHLKQEQNIDHVTSIEFKVVQHYLNFICKLDIIQKIFR